MIIRLQLLTPNNDLVSAGLFNELITMHGTTMIFLAAMPILFGFMNAIMPLQIGARDVAFPFLKLVRFLDVLLRGSILEHFMVHSDKFRMQDGLHMHHLRSHLKDMVLTFMQSVFKLPVGVR